MPLLTRPSSFCPPQAKAKTMRDLTAAEVEEFRQIFELYDENSDGVLSVEEIINAFSEITAESKGKGGMDVQDIINMFDSVDVNRGAWTCRPPR